jgi:hypothetical protein
MLTALGLIWANLAVAGEGECVTHPIAVRGIYGGVPTQILDCGQSLADLGINAVGIGSGALTRERIELLRLKIWPIVQLSEWGEPVPTAQVAQGAGPGDTPARNRYHCLCLGAARQGLGQG